MVRKHWRGIAALSVGLLLLGLLVWTQLPFCLVRHPVTSVFTGHPRARSLLPWGDRNAALTSVHVGLTGPAEAPEIAELTFGFDSGGRKGRSHVVILSNVRRLGWSATGEGLDVEAIQRFDPFAHTPIDLGAVRIDIGRAIMLAVEQMAAPFGPYSSADLQIDLLLRNQAEGLVWIASYDAWTAEGPRGFGTVIIDATSGHILQAQFTRDAASSHSGSG
jgi:hypothetical protein